MRVWWHVGMHLTVIMCNLITSVTIKTHNGAVPWCMLWINLMFTMFLGSVLLVYQ